jgi:hypothetical protein
MDESFEIPVTLKDKELLFPAKLLQLGYTYKFLVDVNGMVIFFEKEDEGNFRAMVDPLRIEDGIKINIKLLEAIAASLEEILE